ncbi:hypothetical protein BaRGS_00030102 [Batillaria attramentaria]|uniref:Uncharacterized protein n=1 Tax=Batillaria attramentaria TaxID=370345 RepID=A0ABD0JUA0_9CAEN
MDTNTGRDSNDPDSQYPQYEQRQTHPPSLSQHVYHSGYPSPVTGYVRQSRDQSVIQVVDQPGHPVVTQHLYPHDVTQIAHTGYPPSYQPAPRTSFLPVQTTHTGYPSSGQVTSLRSYLPSREMNHPLSVTHLPLPVTHNVDQWSTGSGEQAMNNTPAGRQVEGDTSNSSDESDDNVDANDDGDPYSGVVTSAVSPPPPGPSLPASDLPENKQRDLATLSTLYRNTAHVVRRHQDGTDTKEFCNHLKQIETACKSLDSDMWKLNDSQNRTVNDLLIRTGIVDVLCEVMADGLESNDDATWDGDQNTNAAVIAADGLMAFRWTNCLHEVWFRVCDDARLLPVLLKKLKDWYRPHMDKTLKKLQDSVIDSNLKIIYNIAFQDDKRERLRQLDSLKLQDRVIRSSLIIILYIADQDDKRERLRQLGVTGVMVNFLTSPDEDCRFRAGWTLGHIVSEEEAVTLASTEIVTSFCDMPDDWKVLTDNAVIKRVLIQKGALPMLMDRVWEADSDDSKRSETPYKACMT